MTALPFNINEFLENFDWNSLFQGGSITLIFGIAMIVLAIILIMLAVSLALYIVNGIGMMRIAQSRGIENPWLAWVPIGASYMLGAINDSITQEIHHTDNKLRTWMLWISVGILVVSWIPLAGALFVSSASVAMSVLSYICVFRIYQKYTPDNAVLFLVLSIIFSVTMPFFVLYASKKAKDLAA